MPLTLKNFYKQGWQPGANTLVYLPLNGDATNLGTYGTSGDGTLPSSTYYSWKYIKGSSGDKYFYSYSSASSLGNQAQIQGSYSSTALGSSNRTVSIWMKIISGINSNQNYPMYIGSANGGTQGEWFGLWIMDGSQSKLGIIRYYSDPYTNSWTYDNSWHNYIVTYSNTNKAKMYVDGSQVLMTSNANSSFNTIGTNYFIGTGRGNGKVLGLSNFIIENKEWTAQEISDYYNQTKSLYGIEQGWQPGANTIAYYKLEENLNDYSGNNRNLSMGGGTYTYSTLASGKKYCVTNVNAYTNTLSMPFDKNAYTMSVWFNIATKSSNGAILTEVVVGSNYRPRFFWTSQNYVSGLVSLENTGVTWVSGQRYYIVTTYENGTARCYINNNQVGTATFSGTGTSGNFYINPSNSSYRAGGGISELIVENKARTAQEISDYYNQTKSLYGIS